TIQARLTRHAVAIQVPIGAQAAFTGAVDVLSGRATIYEDGKAREAEAPADVAERRLARRETLVEAICETDDDLLTEYLEGNEIDEAALRRALRAAVS